MNKKLSRREALSRAGSMLGIGAVSGPFLSACGSAVAVSPNADSTAAALSPASSATAATPASAGATAPGSTSSTGTCGISTPLGRLQAFMTGVVGAPSVALSVSQGSQNLSDPIDAQSIIYPPPTGYGVNPNPGNLANIPQVWGYRRDTWTVWPATYFNSVEGNSSWFTPVSKQHLAASSGNSIPAALHFIFTGQAFEVLFAGRYPQITLIADGEYCSSQYIETTLANGVPGTLLTEYNTFTKFDFGTSATRRISMYGFGTLPACALAIGPQDTIVPWDRSAEPSMCAMTDSYGQGSSVNWAIGGAFWVAASLLGIPHIDLNAMGGTGYAPNGTNSWTLLEGNTFGSRIPDSVSDSPDLFLTGGGINDDYNYPIPGLYATAAAATAGFEQAVKSYYQSLRTALPNSVIAALGPWAPVQSMPTNPVAQGKLNAIRQALQSITGPWVCIDNLNGGWLNSSGANGEQTGPWQTGTGNVANPQGNGNGDLYVSADGTHPTVAGNMYLGRMLASNLAAAILAL